MVKILVCDGCRQEAERTNHLDLYSTYRSIIFGCKHSIDDLKRDVEEQVSLIQAREGKTRAQAGYAPMIVKHSKIQYKAGRFLVQGDKLHREKKVREEG